MKEITKYEAEDGKVCDTKDECLAYEARLPFINLLRQIEVCLTDRDFADQIEAIGARLDRERRERGELKRSRKSDAAPAAPNVSAANPVPPAPNSPQEEHANFHESARHLNEGVE